MRYSYRLALDLAGNIVSAGYFQNTVDFDPGAAAYELTSAGDFDTFLAGFSPNGELLVRSCVTVRVEDGRGGFDTQSFTIDVLGNRPPEIVSEPVTTASLGRPYRYDVDAIDPDGDPLTYSLATNPPGMTLDPNTGVVDWTPNHLTDVTLDFNSLPSQQGWTYVSSGPSESSTVTVDGTKLVQNTLDTGVTFSSYEINHAFDFTRPFTIELRARVLQTETTASGGRATTLIAFAYTGEEAYSLGLNTDTIDTPRATFHSIDATQFHDYRIEAVPGVSISVFVDDVLLHTGPPPPNHSVGENVLGLGNASSFENGIAEITYFRFHQDPVPVTVRAHDGRSGFDTQSFTIDIVSNRPPEIVSEPVITAFAGHPYTYNVDAIDPNGDPLTFSIVAGPQGMSVAADSGEISWTPPRPSLLTLDFASLPSAQGWSYRGAVAPPEGSIYSVDGTKLVQNTIGKGNSNGSYHLLNVIDPSQPFSIEARVRMLASEVVASGAPASAFNLGAGTGTNEMYIGLDTTRVGIAGSARTLYPFDTTSFHDYRIQFRPGLGFDVYVDGTFLGNTFGYAHNENRIYIGDNSGFENGIAEVTRYTLTQNGNVTVRVDDGRGGFDTQSFVIDVRNDQPAEIHGTKFNDLNGNGLRDRGGEIRVNTTTGGEQRYHDVARDGQGNFTVVWQSQTANGWDIIGQRFDRQGNKIGGEFTVNTTLAGNQTEPNIDMLPTGQFVVAWDGAGVGDNEGFFARRFDSNANPLGVCPRLICSRSRESGILMACGWHG